MFKTQISVLKGHSAKILSLAFSYEKKMMVSAGADKSIIVYDPNSFK
jgi:WD40 repeat protein